MTRFDTTPGRVRQLATYALTVGLFVTLVAGLLPFLACVVVWNIANVMLLAWRCPRCGEPFFRRPLFLNSFARRCLHCALPLYPTEEANT